MKMLKCIHLFAGLLCVLAVVMRVSPLHAAVSVIGDSVTLTCATTDDGNCNYGENQSKFCINESNELPAGTMIKVDKITIAQAPDGNDNVQKIKLTIDGEDYISETVDKTQGNWNWAGNNRVKRVYVFSDGPIVEVGTAYDSAVAWLNGSNGSVTPRFCATQDTDRFFGVSATNGKYTPASILEGTIVSGPAYEAFVYEGFLTTTFVDTGWTFNLSKLGEYEISGTMSGSSIANRPAASTGYWVEGPDASGVVKFQMQVYQYGGANDHYIKAVEVELKQADNGTVLIRGVRAGNDGTPTTDPKGSIKITNWNSTLATSASVQAYGVNKVVVKIPTDPPAPPIEIDCGSSYLISEANKVVGDQIILKFADTGGTLNVDEAPSRKYTIKCAGPMEILGKDYTMTQSDFNKLVLTQVVGGLTIDAKGGLEISNAIKNAIKSATPDKVYTFIGEGNNGATLTFSTGNDFNVTLNTHIVFDGGTHTMTIRSESAGLKFGANATPENPTLRITNNATLTFNARNICGWSSGASTDAGIIRVDNGSHLKLNPTSGTLYWAQQIYLEPGATLTYTDGGNFRINGGTNNAPQIFVPESQTDTIATPARIIRSGNNDFCVNGEGTKGMAISVGANSKLVIEGGIALNNTNCDVVKLGNGILEVVGNIVNQNFIVSAGNIALGGTVNKLTLNTATTIEVAEGKTATINAIDGSGAITKTGAGTLNLPAAYTQAITLSGGLINRTATNTVTINGTIDLGTTELPLSWTLDTASTGTLKLPVGFPFGQIAKVSTIPASLTIKDSDGNAIGSEKFEIDASGYLVLKKSEITVPYNVNEQTIVDDDLTFGEGGLINITHDGAMLTVNGAIALPEENGLPITFVCEKEYVVGTKVAVVKANNFTIGDDNATIDNFNCTITGKLPKGMEGEFKLVESDGKKAIVFEITKSYYTEAVEAILERGALQVRFDASRGITKDDDGNVSRWDDISGNNVSATPYAIGGQTVKPVFVSNDLHEYVDFGDVGSRKDLQWSRTSGVKTVVIAMDIADDWNAFILGDTSNGSFHRKYDNPNIGAYAHNGEISAYNTVRDNGTVVTDFYNTKMPIGFRVTSITMKDNASIGATRFTQDRAQGAGRTGGKKLCEVMLFDKVLTADELTAVENYLIEKWRIGFKNTANIVGEIAWSEIQWKDGRYYAGIETALTITGDTVLTFDTPIGTPDIEFIQESPDYQLEVVIEKESGYAPDVMIETGKQLTLRGGTPEDPFVYTGWVMVDDGGTLVVDGGSVECEWFDGEGIVDVRRGEFRLGSMRGAKLRFAEGTELLVDANSADDGEVTLMFESGSASPTVRFVDGEARHAVIVPVAGGVKITYDPVVSGKACLYDWTFDNGADKGDNRLASVGRNTSALSWDTDYNASNGFIPDEAFTYGIALKTQSTPYSSFTVDYPTEWTCMVAGVLPDVENGALITFGTQGGGLIGLIAGSTENEVKIVRTTGNAPYTVLATMTVPNARTTSHCYAFVKTEDKIVVYLDGVKWNETAVSGANFGASLQIGSVHGNPGSTGIVQVKTATNATAIQAVRIFEGVLGPKSLRRLAEEFPYLSENGTFTRTFSSTSENWVSDESWAKVGSGDKFSEPDIGAELKITAAANTTVKMNFDIANAVYENVSVNGSGSLTFDAGGEGYFAVNTGKTDVNVPITVKYGSLTIAAGPTTIGSSGSITFDYSAYPVDTIHSEGFIPLTGQIDEQSPGKIKLVKPAALLERRMDLVYRDDVYGIEYGFDRDPIDLYFKNPTDALALTNETELVDIDGNVKSRVMKDDALVIANNATFTIATNALDVQLSTLKITNATVTVNIPVANLNGLAKIIVEDGGTLKFDSATAADYTGAIIVNEGGVFDVNGIPDLLMEVTLNGGTMTNSGANVGVDKKQFPAMNFTANSVIDAAHDFGSIAHGYGAHTVNLDGNVVKKHGAGNYYLVNATIGGGGVFEVVEGTLAISSGLAIPADTEFKLTIDSAATVTFANTVTKNGIFNLEVGGSLSAPITLAIDELTVNEGAIVAITSTTAITAANAVQNGSFTVDLSQLQLGETRKQLLATPGLDISRIDFTVDASIEKRLYRLVYIDDVLYVEPNNLTIAIPSVEHADVSVLVDGEPVEVVDEAITIIRGSDVFVNYVADMGWLFQDEESHSLAQYSIELSDVQEAPNPSIAERLAPHIPLLKAKVSIDDVYYLDIGDALDAVHFNEEIRLWTAVALGGGYDVPCDMAINLNGFEMSAEEVLSFVIDGGYSLYLYDGLSHMFGEFAGGSLNNIRFTLSEGTIYSYLNLDYLVDSDRYVRIYSSKVGYTYVAAESVPDLVSQFKPGETETIYLPCDSEATLIPLVEKVESLGYALFATGNENEFSVAISPDAAVNGSWIASFEIANGSATIKIPKAKANFYYGLEYADNPAFENSVKKWAKQGATELSAEAKGANMFYRVLITDKVP